jgi:Dolichyl-phosphate-mannose-protein mannosyltransferase
LRKAERALFKGSFDPVLVLALALALVFSLYGIRWGRVECWNRSEIAMSALSGVRAGSYEKPPFHAYLNHVLVMWPLDVVEGGGKFLTGRRLNLNEAKLLQSRLLVLGMYLVTIALAYWISRQCYGKNPARIIALLFATSAGFIEYDHFLSCDSPLLLWMMLTLFFGRRIALYGDTVSYALAGFSTGLATATKYNGLAVGIIIAVAHVLATYQRGWKEMIFSRRFVLGLIMVPAGFIAGAPFAPFQLRKLITDFTYNAQVTPHYGGQVEGTGYLKFLERVPEILGWPGTYLIAIAAVVSLLIVLWRRQARAPSAICFTLASSVFLLYFAQIGAFPRMETRFVLPAVPFLILMCGPVLQTLTTSPALVFAALAPLFIYNAICSLSIGYRLNGDPRLAAQEWIEHRASAGTRLVLESSDSSPHWIKLPAVFGIEWEQARPSRHRVPYGNVLDLRMPNVNGRVQLFGKIFGKDSWVERYARKMEGDFDENSFMLAELRKRNPDVIAIHSDDYKVPSTQVRKYYADLLSGKAGYRIVLDGKTVDAPPWIYPHSIDHLRGRMTLLTRATVPANPAGSN